MTEFAHEFIPARAAHRLVDRDRELDIIHKAIFGAGKGTRVLLITAHGGMGKTFLLRKVLEMCRERGRWYEAGRLIVPPTPGEDLVDFFHIRTHTVAGFTREVWQVLGAEKAGMQTFADALRRFEAERFHLGEMHRELSKAQDRLGESLLKDLNRLTKKRRLVLALDTAEKLLYEAGNIERDLGLLPEETSTLSWLKETFFPQVKNATILLAGRPESDVLRLKSDLKKKLRDRFTHVDFGNFDEDSAIAYFDAVADAVYRDGDVATAEAIRSIPEDTRRVAFFYTNGRPILLSLLIDYITTQGRLMDEIKDSLEEAKARVEKQGWDNVQSRIEKGLLTGILERVAPEAGVIQSLAWARKGLTAEMLAELHGMSPEEVQKLLKRLRVLSFIKQIGDTYFLHDALYEMFEEHVLERVPRERREKEYATIAGWYEGAIKEARTALGDALRKPLEHRGAAVGQAHARLARLLVDEMHYRWRLSPVSGFQAWETDHQEMYWANDSATQIELDDDVRALLRETAGGDQLNGLARLEVELTLLLHRLKRMLLHAQYDEVSRICEQVRAQCDGLPKPSCQLVGARMDVLRGEALAHKGAGLAEAESALKGAIDSLQKLDVSPSRFDTWRRDITLAEAWNNLGYLYRTMGRYENAVDTYGQAIALWRRLEDEEPEGTRRFGLRAQHANTLNNRAWALAWTGRFEQALRACQDALEIRRGLGPEGPVAFSLNTFGLIQTKADQPHRAERACREALDIFIRLEQPRGIGLALTALSEASRRKAELEAVYSAEEQRKLLEEAIEHAEKAVVIFSEEVKESAQHAQALIELGCAHRDLVRILSGDERNTHRNLGEDALRKAMEVAKVDPNLRHLGIDAEVNLAWLYHYAVNDKAAEQAAESARRSACGALGLGEREIPKKDRRLDQSFLLVQLGKIELLLGEIALQRNDLVAAGEHFAASLAYDERYAPDFRDMRRGLDKMYTLLKDLNADEFKEILKGVNQATENYKNLSSPTRMHAFLEESFGVRDTGKA
ncbi:MAG: hypothetical protein Kow00123_26040 [Anaerolineales bacterium]